MYLTEWTRANADIALFDYALSSVIAPSFICGAVILLKRTRIYFEGGGKLRRVKRGGYPTKVHVPKDRLSG
jgi:hypothetical protein